MQRTILKMLLILTTGLFLSSCTNRLPEKPFTSITPHPTSTPQPINTSTATATPVPSSISKPPSPTPEYFFDSAGAKMIFVAAGEFSMGDSSTTIGDKRPVHKVYLDNYFIDRDAVKNVVFVRFLNENLENISVKIRDGVIFDTPSQTEGTQTYGTAVYLREDLIYCIDCFGWDSASPSQDVWNNSIIWDGTSFSVLDGRGDFPVTMVNWYGAQTYCKWRKSHLPTEAEWVKAYNQGMERSDPVIEWVSDWFAKDYYSHSPYNNPQGPENGTFRLIMNPDPFRNYMSPDFGFWNIGFRCSSTSLD